MENVRKSTQTATPTKPAVPAPRPSDAPAPSGDSKVAFYFLIAMVVLGLVAVAYSAFMG